MIDNLITLRASLQGNFCEHKGIIDSERKNKKITYLVYFILLLLLLFWLYLVLR